VKVLPFCVLLVQIFFQKVFLVTFYVRLAVLGIALWELSSWRIPIHNLLPPLYKGDYQCLESNKKDTRKLTTAARSAGSKRSVELTIAALSVVLSRLTSCGRLPRMATQTSKTGHFKA
jgi:hypothetical protein